jgi:hypothetical protein
MLQKSHPRFGPRGEDRFFEKIVFDQELARDDRHSTRALVR